MTHRLKLRINKVISVSEIGITVYDLIIEELLTSRFQNLYNIGVQMINFDDKRDFYRMMLNSEVIVTIIDDEANSQSTATCRDLSASGMAIEMEHPLAMSTKVKIKLDSASELVQDLYVRGKVVRIDEEYEGCYLVGIYIEEID